MDRLTPIPKTTQTQKQEQKLISTETTAFSKTKARTVHPLSEKEQNEKLETVRAQPRERKKSLNNARGDRPFLTIQRSADQSTKKRASEQIPDSEKASEASALLQNSQAGITQAQSSHVSTPLSEHLTGQITPHKLANQVIWDVEIFVTDIKNLSHEISKINWLQITDIVTTIHPILKKVRHFLDKLKQLKLDYPTHITRGRDIQRRIKHNNLQAYGLNKDGQNEIALLLSNICSTMLHHLHMLLLRTSRSEPILARLIEPIMECSHLWMTCLIEANDSKPNNTRVEETFLIGMNSAISDMTTADIYCRKILTKDKVRIRETIISYRLKFSGLLCHYNNKYPLERHLQNTMLANNFYELHLNYAEHFIHHVRINNTSEVANALETVTLLTLKTPSVTDVAPKTHKKAQKNRKTEKHKTSLQDHIEKSRAFIGNKEHIRACGYLRFYPFNAYFNEAFRAAHIYFNLQIQAVLDSSTSFIAVDDLCRLLNNFEQWINDLIYYDLVCDTDPDFINAKTLLETDKQTLNTLHDNNESFIAEYFKSVVENEKKNDESRKTTKNKSKKEANATIQNPLSQEGTDSETPTEKPIVTLTPETQPSGATAAEPETETKKKIEEEKEENNEDWLQVKKGGKITISADVSLKSISSALHKQNATHVNDHLKSTNLQDARKQIKESECALTPILSQLLLGYTHAMEMTRRSRQCHLYIGDIAPFIDSLLNHGVLPSVKTKDLFVKATENMNAVHEEAQRAFSAALACINILVNTEFKEDKLIMAANTACIALINTIESCSTNLITYSSGIEMAWKKRSVFMKTQAKSKSKSKESRRPQTPKSNTEDPVKKIRENNKLLKDSQRYLLKSKNQLSQKKEEHYSDNTQPPPSEDNVEILQPRTATAQEKLHKFLTSNNLVLDHALTITALNYCTPVIKEKSNESDGNEYVPHNLLVSLASTLDIEIVIMDIDANAQYKIPRNLDNKKIAERPKLADATPHHNTAQPLDKPKDIHSYYHNKMFNILLEINSNEMATPVIMTGSMAYQNHILRQWGEGDSSLRQVYQRHEQAMPEGLTSSQMECIAPRDADLIVMNNVDIESILTRLASLLQMAKNAHPNQEMASKSMVERANPATFFLNNVTCSSHRIVIHGEGELPKSLHYSVDIITGIYPNQPTAEQYTTIPFEGNNRLYIRHIEDIIMDEFYSIRTLYGGEDKKLKDINRLCLLAALENIQPRLETTSRLALLHALISLPNGDPTTKSLAGQLRMRPFNIICHDDGRLQGASRATASPVIAETFQR